MSGIQNQKGRWRTHEEKSEHFLQRQWVVKAQRLWITRLIFHELHSLTSVAILVINPWVALVDSTQPLFRGLEFPPPTLCWKGCSSAWDAVGRWWHLSEAEPSGKFWVMKVVAFRKFWGLAPCSSYFILRPSSGLCCSTTHSCCDVLSYIDPKAMANSPWTDTSKTISLSKLLLIPGFYD